MLLVVMVVVGVLYACMCALLYVHTQSSGAEADGFSHQTPPYSLKCSH